MRATAFVVTLAGVGCFAEPALAQRTPSDVAPERQTYIGEPSDDYGVPQPPADRPPLRYQPGNPVPEGYRIEESYHTPLLSSGAVVLSFNYLLAVVAVRGDLEVGDADPDARALRNMQPLYAPLIGPFVALGGSGWTDGERALLAVNGVAQISGLALAMAGLVLSESYLVYQEAAFGRDGVVLRF
jgi:hypothetical protein